jgi:hypothetical protein
MTDAHHQLFRTYKERPNIVRACDIPVTFLSAKACHPSAEHWDDGRRLAISRPAPVRSVRDRDIARRVFLTARSTHDVIMAAGVQSVTLDDTRITSIDWQTNPNLRFNSVPDSIEVHIIDRPGQPLLRSGETGQGPAAASIANAIANVTGKRLRNLPLTRKRIKNAIDA